MTAWVYRPDHPLANENGMVDRAWIEYTSTDPHVYIISDTMDAVKHMGTGRMHDSKSEFRKDTWASGCIEAGNDPAIRRAMPRREVTQADIVPDVKRAIEQLRSR